MIDLGPQILICGFRDCFCECFLVIWEEKLIVHSYPASKWQSWRWTSVSLGHHSCVILYMRAEGRVTSLNPWTWVSNLWVTGKEKTSDCILITQLGMWSCGPWPQLPPSFHHAGLYFRMAYLLSQASVTGQAFESRCLVIFPQRKSMVLLMVEVLPKCVYSFLWAGRTPHVFMRHISAC